MARTTFRRGIFISFCLAIVVLGIVGLSVAMNFSQMRHEKQWVDHTYEVIETLQDVLSDLKDIQSSQRGYLIAGKEEYLNPYYQSLPALRSQMLRLEDLVKDNPKQVERLNELKTHIDERVQIATVIIQTYKEQGQAKAFEMVRAGTGKHQMDSIRSIIAQMVSDEKGLLETRQRALTLSSNMTSYTGGAGLMACMIILFAVFFLINREVRQRERAEDILKKANKDLERLNHETQIISRMGDYLRGCRVESEAYSIIESHMPLIFPQSFGASYMFNSSQNLLQIVFQWGGREIKHDIESESCWALRQGRMHEFIRGNGMPVCEHIPDLNDGSSVCVPMQAHGKTFGLFFIATAEGGDFSDHEHMTIRSVAEQISLAMANLTLQKALKEQSVKDPLTKLFNRRYLTETLAREISRAERNQTPIAILVMDLDHFKRVNDSYGHDAGDAVLMAFSRLLLTKIRKEDIACRLGGEEFVLVLPAATKELALKRANDICDATRGIDVPVGSQTLNVTVSIGVCIYPDHGTKQEELLNNADQALYQAKNTGRNRVVFFENNRGKKDA